jgi:hypothetical protein
MSYFSKNLGLFVLIVLIGTSCIPEDVTGPTDPTINNPLEISAPTGFTWSTTKDVDVTFGKLFLPISLIRVLTLSTETGTVLFRGAHDLSTDFAMKVSIPSYIQSLTLEVGELKMVEEISNNRIQFAFPIIEDGSN